MIVVQLGDAATALLIAALAGACIGFLPYNFNPAKIFMGDRKISRVNFNRAYVQHLREMSNILNQSLVVLDSKKSVIYPLYFQREMEIRKALVNTFWNILKARNLSIENVVYKDLAGGFDANYYTPPKKQ